MALALGCSPEGLLIAYDFRLVSRNRSLDLFLKLGIEVAVVNQCAQGRELPYTFIFRYALAGYLVALRWMAVAGAKNVKPEKSCNDIVDAPTLFSKEILKASKGHLAL